MVNILDAQGKEAAIKLLESFLEKVKQDNVKIELIRYGPSYMMLNGDRVDGSFTVEYYEQK